MIRSFTQAAIGIATAGLLVAGVAGFASARTSLGLSPGVTGTGTPTDGSVHFPITSGSVVYWSPKSNYRPEIQGIIQHDGSGLSLTAGSTVVGLSNFIINLGNSQLYGAFDVYGTAADMHARPSPLTRS